MHRLSGEDAGFLALELPHRPMHITLLAIAYRQRGSHGASPLLTLDSVRQQVLDRLDELPWLRWRLQRVPLGLHHPLVVEDRAFELGDHLAHVRLPDPGGAEELDRLCAFQASQHLDRRRALWTLTLVDGLRDGGQALLFSAHHCLMDGRAAAASFSAFFAVDDLESVASAAPWQPDPAPGGAQLVVGALRDHLRALPALVLALRKVVRASRAVNRQLRSGLQVPRAGADTPRCSLNDESTTERTYVHTTLSLDAVKHVKDVAGVSVNDVLLAVIAGALVRYLGSRNDLPERPLLALVIVGVDPPGGGLRRWGNRISGLTTSLATDVEDPWERLQVIHEVTADAKRILEAIGPSLLPECLDFIPPWIAESAVRQIQRWRMRDPKRVDHNVTVSNFIGPSAPWSIAGATIDEAYFSGPPTGAGGINISTWSYAGKLMGTVLSFAGAMSSPSDLANDLQVALNELLSRSHEEERTRAPLAS